MKKRIRNLTGVVIVTAAIVFSMIQLNTPVVRASGCPPGQSVGCGCMLTGSVGYTYEGVTHTFCTYMCGGCGGGDEGMYIVQTIEVID